MDYEIIIGGRRLGLLDSVTIRRSVETLGASAVIKLPATCLNKTLNAEQFLHEGDFIDISLGYDNCLKTEFNGWLKSVKTDDNSITIEAGDDITLFDTVKLDDKEFNNISLTALLQTVVAKATASIGTAITVNCDYLFAYQKFVFQHATAFDVLKKIQEDTKAAIWLDNGTLHIHPQYSFTTGNTVIYDFARNVQQSSLKYVTSKDKKIEVTITMTLPDGNKIEQKYGMPGGKTIKREVTAAEGSDLTTIAKSEHALWCIDGYEGNLTGWLVPFCQPADLATIKDADYPTKTGTYYVIATEVRFSSNGGQRIVTLGKRMG